MTIERERRFVATSIDPDVKRWKSNSLKQAYFQTPNSQTLRVRVYNGEHAEMTRKTGRGIERTEHNHDISLSLAEFLFESCPWSIEKTRYYRDGWEIDFFHGPLEGLVLVEYEFGDTNYDLDMPEWFTGVEVTNSITNLHLARMAHTLGDQSPDVPVRELLTPGIGRIVVTGGPCSGKTTALNALQKVNERSQPPPFKICPEAATLIMLQVGVRPGPSFIDLATFQKQLYKVVQSFEELSSLQAALDYSSYLVMDRGTLDATAFLPNGLRDFERLMETSKEAEYSRYDRVVFMEMPPEEIYNRNWGNNDARTETYEEAVQLSARLRSVWQDHPNFVTVDGDTAEEKTQNAVDAIMGIS